MATTNHMKQYDMRYNSPASNWNEALPIGNGRIGAMVFGHIGAERYQVNEDTFWSGFPRDTNNYEAIRYLADARQLIENKKYAEAEKLIEQKMLSVNPQAYQPFTDFWLRLHQSEQENASYIRQLHLNEGIVSSHMSYIGETRQVMTKEAWVSEPHQVLVIHVQSDSKIPFNLKLTPSCPHPTEYVASPYFSFACQAPSHIADNHLNRHPNPVQYEDGKSIKGNCVVKAISDGQVHYFENGVHVTGATSATFLIAIATSFISPQHPPHQDITVLLQKNLNTLDKIKHLSYEQMRCEHASKHQSLFDEVELQLGQNESKLDSHDTVSRLEQYKLSKQDVELEELYFHYAKYLLLSSSRKHTQPTNLQGIWNEHIMPPWFSAYTLNINTQMNYWFAEALGYEECVEPLHRFIEELVVTGKRTAQIHYNARGWTAHHNSDIWRMSSPTSGSASWALFPLTGVWLCQHLWEHYLYSRNDQFLVKIFPILYEAALFALDWLVEDESGRLTTSPSTSPENKFIFGDEVSSVAKGSAIDLTLIYELFSHYLEAAQLLERTEEGLVEIRQAMTKLAVPLVVGDKLLEWSIDYEEHEKGHRHVSHLYGVYPGTQLLEHESSYTLSVKEALRSRIEHGGGHTGWSCAWLINLYARLQEGEQAYNYVQTLLARSTYPNLFDAHPPFQIDGNFGGAAGILEMLVQSHLDHITLLPALPKQWQQGYMKGIRVRGGFTLEMEWQDGKLSYAILESCSGKSFKLKHGERYDVIELETGRLLLDQQSINTKKGNNYRISLK